MRRKTCGEQEERCQQAPAERQKGFPTGASETLEKGLTDRSAALLRKGAKPYKSRNGIAGRVAADRFLDAHTCNDVSSSQYTARKEQKAAHHVFAKEGLSHIGSLTQRSVLLCDKARPSPTCRPRSPHGRRNRTKRHRR